MIGTIRIFLVVAAMVALSLSLIPFQYLFLKLKKWLGAPPAQFLPPHCCAPVRLSHKNGR